MTIEEIEAHRSASPYKVGCEPDYSKKFKRLPRKKKKELKKWLVKYQVKFTLASPFIHDFDDKRIARGVYYSLYRMMTSIKTKTNIEELIIED